MSRAPSRAALAVALSLSKGQISKCARRGMPTDSIEAARAWYAANIRPRMPSASRERASSAGAESAYLAAKARTEAATAELQELRLGVRRGDLVDRAGVERAAYQTGRRIQKALIDVFPSRVAAEVAAITDPAVLETFLRDQLRAELHGIAGDPITGADSSPISFNQ